jgi:hypothetical protein
MNCYIGLVKRIAKSCFPPTRPVPQLEPLDAKNIIKHELKNVSTNKGCFALSDAHERVFKPKPISDEEAWALTVAWAEAKAQERETKAASQTDTDESYDSDDSELGVSIHHMRREVSIFGDDSDDDDDDYDDDNEAIRDMIMRLEKRIAKGERITREKMKSLLKAMLESQSLSDDDTDNE